MPAEVAPFLHSGALGVLAFVLFVWTKLMDKQFTSLLAEQKAAREAFAAELKASREASSERHAALVEVHHESRIEVVERFAEHDRADNDRATRLADELRALRDGVRAIVAGRHELVSEVTSAPPSRPLPTETLVSRSSRR